MDRDFADLRTVVVNRTPRPSPEDERFDHPNPEYR
jgi:hypothetical protein